MQVFIEMELTTRVEIALAQRLLLSHGTYLPFNFEQKFFSGRKKNERCTHTVYDVYYVDLGIVP